MFIKQTLDYTYTFKKFFKVKNRPMYKQRAVLIFDKFYFYFKVLTHSVNSSIEGLPFKALPLIIIAEEDILDFKS